MATVVFLCGCRQGDSATSSPKGNEIKQEETTYVAQSLSLPEYTSFDAYSDGKDLYYTATQLDQASGQYDTAFYTMKHGAAGPEMNFGLPANQRVLKMTMDGEGNIYYLGYEEVPEESRGQMTPDFVLYKVNQKGIPLLTLDLKEYTGGQESAMIQDIAVDGESRIVLITSNQKVFILDPDGQLLFEIRADGRILDICSNGEKVFVAHDGIDGVEIREIDISGKKLSAKLIHNISGNQFYMAADKNRNLLIATEESVYQYDLKIGETIKKFDWQTYDATGITAGILLPYGEKGVLAISRDYATYPMKVEAIAFREVVDGEAVTKENSPSGKTVLTIGVPFNHAKINAEIVAFNKANPDFKIEVKNYEEDYTRLYAEVMTGNCPDILMMPNYRMNQLATGGVLEDLKPYFDEDKTIYSGDFPENILTAFETEGHLYGMPIEFAIDTIVGKTSLVGERSGWNLEELITFTDGFPEGTDIFNDTSKSGVLRLLKYAYTGQLVNQNNAGNPLNRELLVKMLTFANQYENDDQYISDTSLTEKLREEQVILSDINVYGGQIYFGCTGLFGEPVTFIGFPSEEKNGNLIHSFATFAISSGSENKDIAWKFISTLLSEEAQMRMAVGISQIRFPIRKDVLEYKFVYATENYNGYHMSSIIGSNNAEYRFTLGEMNEEDIEPIRDLIQNANMALTVSPDIDQIIEEEASLYFSGIKPVEEVVDVIENRIRTYVNETK